MRVGMRGRLDFGLDLVRVEDLRSDGWMDGWGMYLVSCWWMLGCSKFDGQFISGGLDFCFRVSPGVLFPFDIFSFCAFFCSAFPAFHTHNFSNANSNFCTLRIMFVCPVLALLFSLVHAY